MSEENLNTNPEANAEANANAENNHNESKLSYDDLQAELKRVRQEAASRRIAERELKEKAKAWEEYQESQKTELQKLQEALADKDKKLANYEFEQKKYAVLKEFELDDDDLVLLTGSDEEVIRKQAENLKAKNDKIKAQNADSSRRPADLLAGNRGTPVGSTNDINSFDNMLRAMARGRQ